MKAIGCLLLLSGWLIVVFALALLHPPAERYAFVATALAVEALGLGVLAHSYRADGLSR